jgi:hypothetical protein
MVARSTRSNQRPDTLMQDPRADRSTKPSCDERPDHTVGQRRSPRTTGAPWPEGLAALAGQRGPVIGVLLISFGSRMITNCHRRIPPRPCRRRNLPAPLDHLVGAVDPDSSTAVRPLRRCTCRQRPRRCSGRVAVNTSFATLRNPTCQRSGLRRLFRCRIYVGFQHRHSRASRGIRADRFWPRTKWL